MQQELAYDEVNNKLYITDTDNNFIQVLSNASTAIAPAINAVNPSLSIFAGATSGITIGKVNAPRDVSVDINGMVYVADTLNNRIQINTNGTANGWAIFASATAGTTTGKVNAPRGIYVDAANNVYIADTNNNSVQMNVGGSATSTGTWSVPFTVGVRAGFVRLPEGVSVSATGNLFVGDIGNNRIQRIPSFGGTATIIGATGSGSGQFNRPTGVR
jgi:hypothetical protein